MPQDSGLCLPCWSSVENKSSPSGNYISLAGRQPAVFLQTQLPDMKKYLPLAAIALLLAACSKDNDDQPQPEDDGLVKTGVYSVANLVADTSAASSGGADTLYFSLEQNKAISKSRAQTADWDVAFVGIYNSTIVANNGTASNSPGFGGPGKGGLYLALNSAIESQYYNSTPLKPNFIPGKSLIDQAFSEVKQVPVADNNIAGNAAIGLDHFFGTSDGWGFYDFYGTMYPDRPADEKAHVVYALPRTIIVRTAKGRYAKLVIYSFYKDAPADPDRSHKTGYISFKYAIQMDGSKQLDIQ